MIEQEFDGLLDEIEEIAEEVEDVDRETPSEGPPIKNKDPKGRKGKFKTPPAKEMFKMLFPTFDPRKANNGSGTKPQMTSKEKLDFLKPRIRAPKIEFPEESKKILQEVRNRRHARKNGFSFAKSGNSEISVLVANPKKTPKDGIYRMSTKEGKPVLYAEYKNGLLHGDHVKYVNGVIKETSFYQHGLLEGVQKSFNEEGRCILHAEYKNGKLHGAYRKYNADLTPIMKTHFYENRQHGICVIYTQGSLSARISFVNGKKHGNMIAYMPVEDPDNPPPIAKVTLYQNDLMEGASVTYYPSGQKFMEENYQKNLRQGSYIEYFHDGSIRKIAHYEKGKLLKKPEIYDIYGNKKESSFG